MNEKETIINNYVEAYNNFDIESMIADFSNDIVFENISNGETNLSIRGIDSFLKQAETAVKYFSKRTQTIRSIKHDDNKTEIEIGYDAVAAIDLPNGIKKGSVISLSGRSVFEFEGNKITKLTDIS